ncbi:unnamed protein product [Urochloa humidicola]
MQYYKKNYAILFQLKLQIQHHIFSYTIETIQEKEQNCISLKKNWTAAHARRGRASCKLGTEHPCRHTATTARARHLLRGVPAHVAASQPLEPARAAAFGVCPLAPLGPAPPPPRHRVPARTCRCI